MLYYYYIYIYILYILYTLWCILVSFINDDCLTVTYYEKH